MYLIFAVVAAIRRGFGIVVIDQGQMRSSNKTRLTVMICIYNCVMKSNYRLAKTAVRTCNRLRTFEYDKIAYGGQFFNNYNY